MTSILLRAPKSPFEPATVERTLAENLIGNNSGNLVFIGAAWKLLATRSAEITPAGMGGSPTRAAELSERHDVYVAPLADAFRLGWEASLERMTAFIEQLTIPVVILGVGAQGAVDFSPDRLRPIEPIVKRFVAAVLERGPTIGVRGENTATYLEGLGFRDVEVIGCPSMFMHGDRLEVSKRVRGIDRDSRLAINIGHSRGSPAMLVELGVFIDHHVQRYPTSIHFAQDRSTLELLVNGAIDPTDAATPPDAARRVASAAPTTDGCASTSSRGRGSPTWPSSTSRSALASTATSPRSSPARPRSSSPRTHGRSSWLGTSRSPTARCRTSPPAPMRPTCTPTRTTGRSFRATRNAGSASPDTSIATACVTRLPTARTPARSIGASPRSATRRRSRRPDRGARLRRRAASPSAHSAMMRRQAVGRSLQPRIRDDPGPDRPDLTDPASGRAPS